MKRNDIINKIVYPVQAEDVKRQGPLIDHSAMSSVKEEEKLMKNRWHNIDWKKAKEIIGNYQEKIVIATLNKDMKKVYNLQWRLINSFEARALAIFISKFIG